MKRDLNYVAALEKAMMEKYGEQTVINPKAGWNPEKEQEYINQTKEAYKKEALAEQTQEKVDLGGVLIAKKLINKNNDRQCNYCGIYSFNRNDDVFFSKYNMCNNCFIKHVDGREERWKNGWRPKKHME